MTLLLRGQARSDQSFGTPASAPCGTPFPAQPFFWDPNRVRDALLHSITKNPIFAEAISNFGQTHKHLHLTKYIYHEDIQAFSK